MKGETDYRAENDADTLQRHAEITGDPKRHEAAHAKLVAKQQQTNAAVGTSQKALRGKVKKGLSKAFPKAGGGDTPFGAAGKNGGTPFDKAGED